MPRGGGLLENVSEGLTNHVRGIFPCHDQRRTYRGKQKESRDEEDSREGEGYKRAVEAGKGLLFVSC